MTSGRTGDPNRQKTTGVLIMIEMACPRCGAGGRIPRDKLNSRLVCKKCLQVFHLNATHQAVIGEPPALKATSRKKERVAREGGVQIEIPGLEGLSDRLSKLKLPDPKVIGVTAVVLLAVAFFGWLFSKRTVDQQSQVLAQAIRDLDLQTASNMALPGTEMQAMEWLNGVYKNYLDLKMAIGNFDPGVQINAQENSDGTAQTMMVFSREGATTNGPIPVQQAANLESKDSNAKKSMELVVAWAKDTWGIWRLDGKQTLDNAKRHE